IARIRFIKNAKSVGFTLEEVYELLSLQVHGNTTSQDIRQRTIKKLQVVQEKIAALQKIENALRQLVTSCDGKMPLHECPILEALYAETEDTHCLK
ncbi:MerR family DNA-binding protein, partial [Paenibacillus jilunlii]